LAKTFYPGLVNADEVFVSDGSKCDIARLQVSLAAAGGSSAASAALAADGAVQTANAAAAPLNVYAVAPNCVTAQHMHTPSLVRCVCSDNLL
jgi:LL-diaminopimelate aminotransferase